MSYGAVVIRMIMNFKQALQTFKSYRNQKMKHKTYLRYILTDGFEDNIQKQSKRCGAIQLKSNNK